MENIKKSKNFKFVIAIVVAIVIIIFLAMTVRTVDTGEVAVVTRFGELKGSVGAGIHFKSPLDEYHTISVTQNQIDEIYYTATKDTQSINQQVVTQVAVDPSLCEELYRKFKGNHIEAIVKPILYDGFKSATAQFTLEGAIAQRDALAEKMLSNVKERLVSYGINVVSVEIKDVQIPQAYAEAVEGRKVAEQTKIKTEVEKETAIIRAEQELEVKKLEAEAKKLEAQVNEEISSSLTPEILQRQWLEKWDGKLPVYMGGDGGGMNMYIPVTTGDE
jgi:regulator of protease activity HflC (stomatin/prohibitin superfamily)